MFDLLILFFVNLITFLIFAIDKMMAERAEWRIPEFFLLIIALLGGAFGALCGMIFFNHKVHNRIFRICIPVFLYIQLAFEIIYRLSIIHYS